MKILKEGHVKAPKPHGKLRGTCERCRCEVECDRLETLAPRIEMGRLVGNVSCPTAGCGGTLIHVTEHVPQPPQQIKT